MKDGTRKNTIFILREKNYKCSLFFYKAYAIYNTIHDYDSKTNKYENRSAKNLLNELVLFISKYYNLKR